MAGLDVYIFGHSRELQPFQKMVKRFKFRFPFQFCRFSHRSSRPENPLPEIYQPYRVNNRALDVACPTLTAPPSTPENPIHIRHVSKKIVSVGCGCGSRSWTQKLYSAGPSPDYAWKKEAQGPNQSQRNKSRFSKSEERCNDASTSVLCINADEEQESESLVFSSTSFSNDWSNEFIDPAEIARGESARMETDIVKKSRELKRCESIASSASALRRRILRTMHGTKVRESFAVVKRTEDPYEEFKRSMLEMILQKQLFETKDLEELLQCFLSLNSASYHGVIVKAFSEIWELLFSDSPGNGRASLGL